MSTMDDSAEVAHNSCPNNIDNEKNVNAGKDNEVDMSEMVPNEENIKKEDSFEKTIVDKKLVECKNVSNDDKVCKGNNNKESAVPRGQMSKRALRKVSNFFIIVCYPTHLCKKTAFLFKLHNNHYDFRFLPLLKQ